MDEQKLCAVEDCPRQGSPQVCPYDGSRHGHGMIHYGSPGTPEQMKFRDGWRQVCAEHYDILLRAREQWEASR